MRTLIFRFIPLSLLTATVEQGCSQEPRAQSMLPSWVAGTQLAEPSLAAISGCALAETRSEEESPGFEPGALIWAAAIPRVALTTLPNAHYPERAFEGGI